MNNACIRVLADPEQIKQCRESVMMLESSINDFSRIFNLAGNAVRLKILFLLHKEGEMCPCDLSDVLSLSVSAVSQHLRKLKDGRIVQDKKVGQIIFYSLNTENIEMVRPVLESLTKGKKKELVL